MAVRSRRRRLSGVDGRAQVPGGCIVTVEDMRVLVVGATGVIGRELLPALRDVGHEVVGTSRSADGAASLAEFGATGEVVDVYDGDAVRQLLGRVRPTAVISQVTDLPDSVGELASHLSENARVRREAVPGLVTAAKNVGVAHVLVQSIAWQMDGEGAAAVEVMESATLAAEGVVLRYGQFYGPGTFHDTRPEGPAVSLTHAAARTVELITAPSGVETVVDPG